MSRGCIAVDNIDDMWFYGKNGGKSAHKVYEGEEPDSYMRQNSIKHLLLEKKPSQFEQHERLSGRKNYEGDDRIEG